MASRRERKAESFRSHVNALFMRDLDALTELYKQTFNYTVFEQGRRALVDGDLEEYANCILELKSEAHDVTLDLEVGVQRPDELKDEPLETLPVHVDNVVLRPQGIIDVALKSELYVKDRCDPADCSTCEPCDSDIKVDKTSVVIYAGPGAGKTSVIKSIPPNYRGSVYDTAHLRDGFKVPPHSLVLTSSTEVLNSAPGLRLAFIPYRRHWERQCLMVRPNIGSTFIEACCSIKNCFVVRRNCHLGDILRIRPQGMRRRRPPR